MYHADEGVAVVAVVVGSGPGLGGCDGNVVQRQRTLDRLGHASEVVVGGVVIEEGDLFLRVWEREREEKSEYVNKEMEWRREKKREREESVRVKKMERNAWELIKSLKKSKGSRGR